MVNYDDITQFVQIINTIQGEGFETGVPSLLLRVYGCNCRCAWCDSKYTHVTTQTTIVNSVDMYTIESVFIDLKERILKNHIRNIMLTGGEPFLYQYNTSLVTLLKKLLNDPDCDLKLCEIESNGSLIDLTSPLGNMFIDEVNINLNISPKLNIDFYKNKIDFENLVSICSKVSEYGGVCFKFVDDGTDLVREEILKFINDCYIDTDDVLIMPQTPLGIIYTSLYDDETNLQNYRDANKKTLKFCMKHGFRFCNRLHLELFDNRDENI